MHVSSFLTLVLNKTNKFININIRNQAKIPGFQNLQTEFSGNITTLRNHIARNDDHYEVYRENCIKKEVPMNARAIPNAEKERLAKSQSESNDNKEDSDSIMYVQQSITQYANVVPNSTTPEWTKV
jgi:hypothetical protein